MLTMCAVCQSGVVLVAPLDGHDWCARCWSAAGRPFPRRHQSEEEAAAERKRLLAHRRKWRKEPEAIQ